MVGGFRRELVGFRCELAGITLLLASLLLGGCSNRGDSAENQVKVGTMNGIPLAIPLPYLRFPVEYEGESVWAPERNPPKRTFESKISNFVLYVKWPGMEAPNDSNIDSFKQSTKTSGEHSWLNIGVTRIGPIDADKVDTSVNYLARHLRATLANKYLHNFKSVPSGVSYQRLGYDQSLLLNQAAPVGPGTERFRTWNQKVYWSGDPSGEVDTYIECHNGTILNNITARCTQEFWSQELDANISVTYTKNHLESWREIQADIPKLIQSFYKR